MSNKKVCAYETDFYYLYNDVPLTADGHGNYHHIVNQHPFYGNWFENAASNGVKCGYWSLVNKYYDDGSGKYDRMIIHDLKVDFNPHYTEDVSGFVKWCIVCVKNNAIYNSPTSLGALKLNTHGVVCEASKQIMISDNFRLNNFANNGWSAKSQNFANLDFDLPVEDNLLLLMNISLDAYTIPDSYMRWLNGKRTLLTRKNFAHFDIAFTYSYSRL